MSYICALHHIEVQSDYQLCPKCWEAARISIFPEFKEYLHGIMAKREEILKAFIAEVGCLPSEVQQVEEYTPGGIRWYVRKRA